MDHRGRAPHYYPLYFSKLSQKHNYSLFNPFEDPRCLPCRHSFCYGCFVPLLEDTSLKCPVCRCVHTRVRLERLTKNFALNSVLENGRQTEQTRRFETCQEHHPYRKSYYCETCRKYACAECLIEVHKNHEFENLKNEVQKAEGDLGENEDCRIT